MSLKREGRVAAGIYSTAQNVEVLMNSRGLFRYYFDTLTQFSITAMAGDSSGWAKGTSSVHQDVWPVKLASASGGKGYSVAQPARDSAREVHGNSRTCRRPRSGGPDLHGFQRDRDRR